MRKPDSSDFVSVALDISGNFQTIDDKWATSAAADIGAAAAAGSALTVARTDHVHRVASGTVSAPGLPVGESNTGFYRPGTGQLAATIAGVSGWTLTSASLQLEEALSVKKIATPSNPSSGYSALYPKSDENWYRLTSAGAEVAMIDTTAFNASVPTAVSAAFARKNRLVNPSFYLNQRGTLTTTDNTYGFDRWRLLLEAASAGTLAQETSDVPTAGGITACKLVVGATNNDKIGVFQPIEGYDISDMRGGVASLQVQMKVSNARIGDVRAAIVQWTGTRDAVSADPINVWGAALTVPTYTGSWANANTPANLSPTTSWAQYKIENVSISGSATNLGVFIWIDDKTTTAGDYLLVTDVQLEKGSVCTAFERRPISEELMMAKRYCELWTTDGADPHSHWGVAQAYAATSCVLPIHAQVEKRATNGTITLPAGSNLEVVNSSFSSVGVPSTVALNDGVGQHTFSLQLTGIGTITLAAGDACVVRWSSTLTTPMVWTSEL